MQLWRRYYASNEERAKHAKEWPNDTLPPKEKPAFNLILTKMMRGDDPQDLADTAFMIRHDGVTPDQVESAITDAVIPDLAELREAFERAKPRVREMVRQAG